MLSVYLDGELPSPWKEKLESHVSGCKDCAARIESYRSVFPAPARVPATDTTSEAGERVWQRLDASARQGRLSRRRAIWRRNVSLPLPAIAAAAVALVVVTTFAGTLLNGGGAQPSAFGVADAEGAQALPMMMRLADGEGFDEIALASEGQPPVDGVSIFCETDFHMTALDMESVAEYLRSRGGENMLVFHLPAHRSFQSNGEPAVIRAADYLRQIASWHAQGRN